MQSIKISIIVSIIFLWINTHAQLPPENQNYELVFEDEFDSTGINSSRWNHNPSWNQTGYIDVYYCQNIPSGWITPELYGYRKRNFDNCILDTTGTGILSIVSKEESYYGEVWNWPLCTDDSCNMGTGYHDCDSSLKPPKCWDVDYEWFNYTTNRLWSREKFKYGYFEISCKLPKPIPPQTNTGIGPNFWLWYADSLVSWSEIDLFEFDGMTNKFVSGVSYESEGDTAHVGSEFIYVDFSTSHHFSALWTPQKIEFYLDGSKYLTTNLLVDELITMPLIIDVNFPLHTMCQLIDTLYTVLPHYYEIDYVKVYQLKPDCSTDYHICSYSNIDYAQYKSITIGGDTCNVVVPSNENLYLISSDGLEIISNFTVEPGAEFSYEVIPCFESLHTFPSKGKSETTPNPAPPSYYKRNNREYHD